MKKKEIIDFSLVIPVYNSAKSLRELYERINSVFIKMSRTFEIIFVNDCSKDDSLSILKEIHDQHENVTVIDLYANFGQQNALMCGFNYCNGNFVITLDDDLQNPPEEIPKLVEKLNEGYDAVFGFYTDKKDKFYKNIGSAMIRMLNHRIFNVKNNLSFSSFRIIKKEVIDQIKDNKTKFPYISGMLLGTTRNIANVTLLHEKRKYGKSNYTLNKLLKISFNLLINHSTIPLRFFGYMGLIVSIMAFFISVFIVIRKILAGGAPTGWTSLVVLISFYNIVILIAFFIIGEYISRILKESSNAKQYSIRSIWK